VVVYKTFLLTLIDLNIDGYCYSHVTFFSHRIYDARIPKSPDTTSLSGSNFTPIFRLIPIVQCGRNKSEICDTNVSVDGSFLRGLLDLLSKNDTIIINGQTDEYLRDSLGISLSLRISVKKYLYDLQIYSLFVITHKLSQNLFCFLLKLYRNNLLPQLKIIRYK